MIFLTLLNKHIYLICTAIFIIVVAQYAITREKPYVRELLIEKAKLSMTITPSSKGGKTLYLGIHHNGIEYNEVLGSSKEYGFNIAQDYMEGDYINNAHILYEHENCSFEKKLPYCSRIFILGGQYFSQKYQKFYEIRDQSNLNKWYWFVNWLGYIERLLIYLFVVYSIWGFKKVIS